MFRRAVLDGGSVTASRSTEYSAPRVGVDANGASTVAWTRWMVAGGRGSLEHVRLAHSAPGGIAWEPARDLGISTEGSDRSDADPHVGLATAPAGQVLVAWPDGAAIRAVEGGEDGVRPAVALAAGNRAGLPAVALADSGAAVVAFSQLGTDGAASITAIHRAPGAAWSAARVSGAPAGQGDDAPEGRPVFELNDAVALASALAPDGRAVVAWEVTEPVRLIDRVVAATGRPGEAWDPVRVLSVPTRDSVGAPSAFVDDTGYPRVAWIERTFGPRGRLRTDRIIPDAGAPVADTTPPAVTVALSGSVRLSRTGSVAPLRLSVRCSEACDVRADLVIPQSGLLPEAMASGGVRARQETRLAFRDLGGPRLRTRPGVRHLRLRVLAADRAGNVTERTRLVALVRR
jgi:hypothetical protein